MKTQYYTACSLDGFIATEDHSLEWLFPLADINQTSYPAFIKEVGAIAMGSSTYEWLLRHAVKLGSEQQEPWPYEQPVWVFTSRELPRPPGATVNFVNGDVRPIHGDMRSAALGKNIWIMGGGDLAGQFHDAGLLDELIVQIGSVTLGSGRPVLPRCISSPTLQLMSVQAFGSGMAELRYKVASGN
jgi:dihydrofolate reductase